jgi:hypothetical protein
MEGNTKETEKGSPIWRRRKRGLPRWKDQKDVRWSSDVGIGMTTLKKRIKE